MSSRTVASGGTVTTSWLDLPARTWLIRIGAPPSGVIVVTLVPQASQSRTGPASRGPALRECRPMRRELPAWTSLALMGWLSAVLWLDRASAGGGLWQQRALGLLTWVVLAGTLLRVSPVVRAQTLVVVAFATCVEYVFSPALGVYTYRFHNVPAYVPPGHGLVYLSAFALGHAVFLQPRLRAAAAALLALLGSWAAYGLLGAG